MIGWPRRSGRRKSVTRVALRLEQLEQRDCPAAPVIGSFSAIPLNAGHWVELQGSVIDENPSSVTITFGGAVSGTAAAEADGQFSYVTEAAWLGSVTAVALDEEYFSSAEAVAQIASDVPAVVLDPVVYGAERAVTLSGRVLDEESAGRVVTFSGVAEGSTITNLDGTFSWTSEATGLGTIEAITVDPWGQISEAAAVVLTSTLPSLALTITQGQGRTVTLSGTVTDESPANRTVTFSGAVMGSAVTDSSGYFSWTGEADYLGVVQAYTTDPWGQTSNVAEVTLTNQAPAVSLNITYGSERTITLSGTVSDEFPGVFEVSFTGVVSGSIFTDENGSFTWATEASSLGVIQVVTTDAWGQQSALAQVTVTSNAPSLTLTAGQGPGRTVTLSGTVTDESPGGRTVTFTGAVMGSTITDSSGYFSWTGDADYLGTIQASTTDPWVQTSNVAQVTLTNQAPTISLTITYGTERTITLSGTVSDEFTGVFEVAFSGVVSGSIFTDGTGTFTWTTEATSLGVIQAVTTDAWGQQSTSAQVSVTSNAPSLTLAANQGSGRMVTLSGTVTDESPGGRTVTFSGAAMGSAITDSDGSFSWTGEADYLGTIQAVATDPWGQTSNVAEVTLTNQAPTISLNVTYGTERTVTLSGTVNDDYPGVFEVTFSGVVTGSIFSDSNGTFTWTTDATSLGVIEAVTADAWGQQSTPAQVTVTSSNPTVSLEITYGTGNTITLTGVVIDESPGGRTVTFSGAVAGSVITNPDGTFSWTTTASELGSVQATTTDPWGLVSAPAEAPLTSNPPAILDFQAIEGPDNLWTFQGRVTDESATGLVVRFGGLTSLQGMTATVDESGWFYLTIRLQPGEEGTATAQTTDWWNLDSNLATTFVDPTN